jgi:hypothetical protein
MIHNKNVSYYPKAGMFREGRKMYSVRHFGLSDAMWYEMMARSPEILYIENRGGNGVWITLLRYYYGSDWIGYVQFQNIYPVIHVWRVQRAVRLFLRKQYEQRALALAMGQHARLGGELCAYACLPADLLALCVR